MLCIRYQYGQHQYIAQYCINMAQYGSITVHQPSYFIAQYHCIILYDYGSMLCIHDYGSMLSGINMWLNAVHQASIWQCIMHLYGSMLCIMHWNGPIWLNNLHHASIWLSTMHQASKLWLNPVYPMAQCSASTAHWCESGINSIYK